MQDTYDFIVAGAGSAGCCVAARLSESGVYRVLLLEAGVRDNNVWVHIPLGYQKLYANPALNWMFESEPVPGLDNRTSYQPRGKMLGGTSSINGMIYMRGTAADYDGWRQRGLEGWGYDSVLPYFRKAEDNQRGADEFHGAGGPLKVSDYADPGELPRAIVEASVEAGIPRNPDFNGAKQEGVGFYQTTTANGRRWSAAKAYLTEARKRANLTIVTEAQATRILLEEGRAVGIEYRVPGGFRQARANIEVIASGGVYGSAQLLLLSGIGPGAHLKAMGIPVLRDMPGVGSHLHDHFNSYVAFECPKPITLNDLYRSPMKKLSAGLAFAFARKGPLASAGLYAGAMVKSDERFAEPDLQLNMFIWSIAGRDRNGVRPHPFPGFNISPVHLRPEGRGTVRLKSPNPMEDPEIRFNYLATDYDIQAMLAGIRIARTIGAQAALKPYVVREVAPGPDVQSEAELIKDLRQRGVSNLHPVGTCRMGGPTDSVVDQRLRVHGIKGLRVIDASVMPQIVAGNTNAPTIMIAERASEIVKRNYH